MKLSVSIGLAAVAVLFAGCASAPKKQPYVVPGSASGDGRPIEYHGAPKDLVVWQYRTALESLRRGKYEEAKALLDDALLTVEANSANDKEAKRSRGYFSQESRKTFRGEPYERIMAYFYRGILYWRDGQPDNARACFRSAQIQDSDTENKQYANDYVLLDYLDGLATAELAGDGSDAFKRANDVSKVGPLPPYNPKANALFFLEFGTGPLKHATGDYHEQLRFRAGTSKVRAAVIRVAGQSIQMRPYDDLNFQATTRGGRVMDHILANKAVFKTTTDTMGNAALISGMVVASNRNTQEAGLGLLAFGLASKILAASTTPAADTRCWNNLPQYLSFAAVELPPGQYAAEIEFLDASGHPVPVLNKTATINVSPDRDTIVFVSDRSHTSQNL